MNNYEDIKRLQPRAVRSIEDFDKIARGQSKAFEMIEGRVDKLYNNSFLISLEFDGIERWEKIYGIEPYGGYETRRNAIIAYSQGRGKLSSTKIKNMAYSYGAECVEVSYNKEKSMLEVEIIFSTGVHLEFNSFLEMLEELKPARLMINYKTVLERASTFYIGMITLSGEEITVYPYSPKSIESKGSIYIATGSNTGLENVTVYPRKEVV